MPQGWDALPPEMNLSILDLLSLEDLKAFSAVSRLCRQLAMSTLFKVRASDRYPSPVPTPTLPSPSDWMDSKSWSHSSLDSRPDVAPTSDHSVFLCGRVN